MANKKKKLQLRRQLICWVILNITFPAESKPNIKIRTSWSLLHRTSDVSELNRVDIERPMEEIKQNGGRAKKGGEEGMSERKKDELTALTAGVRGTEVSGVWRQATCRHVRATILSRIVYPCKYRKSENLPTNCLSLRLAGCSLVGATGEHVSYYGR